MKEPTKLDIIIIIRCIFGFIFLVCFFVSLVGLHITAALIALILVLIVIPPISDIIESKLNFTLSGALRFVLVFCLLVGFGIVSSDATPTHISNDTQTTPLSLNTNSTMAPPSVTPCVVASWTGNSIKNTETFHISSNEWKIKWMTKPGKYGAMNFFIIVHNADGSMKELVANVIGASEDSIIEKGSGDYYLNINTEQPYSVEVDEE